MTLKNHDLVEMKEFKGIRYELKPAKTPDGTVAEGLHNAWIWLDNPEQFNSYTTDMVKSLLVNMLEHPRASHQDAVRALLPGGLCGVHLYSLWNARYAGTLRREIMVAVARRYALAATASGSAPIAIHRHAI